MIKVLKPRQRFNRGDTLVEIAKTYDVAHTSISRLMASVMKNAAKRKVVDLL